MPTAAATARAPSSSPVASAGDRAVTASARSPSTRAEAAATSEESTPPENATTALGVAAMVASSSSSEVIELLVRTSGRHREGLRPDLFDGTAGRGGGRSAVVVLGHQIDDGAIQQSDLDADRLALDPHLADRAIQLVSRQLLDPHAERRGVADQRLSEDTLIGRTAEDAQLHARSSLLHLDGGGPGVERTGCEACVEHVGDQLGDEVVDVGLEHDDLTGRRFPSR